MEAESMTMKALALAQLWGWQNWAIRSFAISVIGGEIV
jgi:hypothetical protein